MTTKNNIEHLTPAMYGMPNLGCLVGTAYQRMTSELEVALKRAGVNVSVAEYLVLRALYCTDGLQQCEIVDMLGKDKSAVCRTVTSLTRKGLVRTEQVSYKCLKVWLLPEGKDLEPAVMRIANERHKALMNMATDKEMAVFVRILKKIIEQN